MLCLCRVCLICLVHDYYYYYYCRSLAAAGTPIVLVVRRTSDDAGYHHCAKKISRDTAAGTRSIGVISEVLAGSHTTRSERKTVHINIPCIVCCHPLLLFSPHLVHGSSSGWGASSSSSSSSAEFATHQKGPCLQGAQNAESDKCSWSTTSGLIQRPGCLACRTAVD